jgi:GNAT superfamily N-acetyltransferase
VASAAELYRDAFVARRARLRQPGEEVWAAPGACGVVGTADGSVRLLVTDDRALDDLAALLGRSRAGVVTTFDGAARATALLRGDPDWRAERPVTAMVRHDLDGLPGPPLPDGLALRPVRRLAEDDGVPLEAAVACAAAADPSIEQPEVLAAYLRTLPPTLRLVAAVDAAGTVRGTAGCDAGGEDAGVLFVDTHPAWQGRGIASALTAAALRAAASAGARRATLDATDVALSVYRRLGFEPAGRIERFTR